MRPLGPTKSALGWESLFPSLLIEFICFGKRKKHWQAESSQPINQSSVSLWRISQWSSPKPRSSKSREQMWTHWSFLIHSFGCKNGSVMVPFSFTLQTDVKSESRVRGHEPFQRVWNTWSSVQTCYSRDRNSEVRPRKHTSLMGQEFWGVWCMRIMSCTVTRRETVGMTATAVQ